MTKQPCDNTLPPSTVMPPIELTMYGPVIGQCAPEPILGGEKMHTFIDKTIFYSKLRLLLTYILTNCELEK